MEDKNINTKLYIPSNVKTRFEFIRGFGINELIVTSIVVAFLIGIALVIYSITIVYHKTLLYYVYII